MNVAVEMRDLENTSSTYVLIEKRSVGFDVGFIVS